MQWSAVGGGYIHNVRRVGDMWVPTQRTLLTTPSPRHARCRILAHVLLRRITTSRDDDAQTAATAVHSHIIIIIIIVWILFDRNGITRSLICARAVSFIKILFVLCCLACDWYEPHFSGMMSHETRYSKHTFHVHAVKPQKPHTRKTKQIYNNITYFMWWNGCRYIMVMCAQCRLWLNTFTFTATSRQSAPFVRAT